jgi:hypothetical protein
MIAVVGTPQSGSAENGSDLTLTFDVAPSQGDVVLVFGGHGETTSVLAAPTPAGYTEIWITTVDQPVVGAWYKVMGGSPDSNVVCDGGGSTTDAVTYCCYVLSGVDAAVLDQTTTAATNTTGLPNSPSITTQTDNAWVFSVGYSDLTDGAVVTPTGYSTPVGTSGFDTNDVSVWSAYLEIPTAGAEDPDQWLSYGIKTRWHAITVAIRVDQGGSSGGFGSSGSGLSFGKMGKMGA